MEHLECVSSPRCRRGCVGECVLCGNSVSSLSYFSYHPGVSFVSPGDGQSVLALQYTEKINFPGGWAQYSAGPGEIAQLEYVV